MDRRTGPESVGRRGHRDLRHLRRDSRDGGKPHRVHGLVDYLGEDFRSAGGLPVINVPGCPVQPDNFMETWLWVLHQARIPRQVHVVH
ncbi:hypothetical protein [Saccharomonospora sp.]|uniref:hypothetical protein n=1 Tax=Saccharomonospora sp. TaxID=33913 RepID=UPI00342FB3AE